MRNVMAGRVACQIFGVGRTFPRRWRKKRGGSKPAPLLSVHPLLRFNPSRPLRREAAQRTPDISFAEPLERPIAELTNPLASDAEHAADFLERVLASAFEAEVEAQHLRVARRQRGQRLLDLVREEAVHCLLLGVRHLIRHEALDERAVALGIHGRVEAYVARVERCERLHDVHRQARELAQLFGTRLTVELLPENLTRLDDAREIRRAVERNADGAALPRERGKDRLADPPYGVGDELDALVGIEFPGGREQADVTLADEIDERESAVLIFLGDGDDERQVALDEVLECVLVAGADLSGELDLLRPLEEGIGGDFVQVLVEDVALGLVGRDARGRGAAPAYRLFHFGHGCLVQVLRVRVGIYELRRTSWRADEIGSKALAACRWATLKSGAPRL